MTEVQSAITYRPRITIDESVALILKLFGLKCLKIQELNAYDDKNYKIQVSSEINNPNISSVSKDGYVFKILNSLDSKLIGFIEAQHATLLHLNKKNIKCPQPVRTNEGKYFSIEHIADQEHMVRLFEFVPGTIFCEIPCENHLIFQLGEYVASFDNYLKDLNFPVLLEHRTIWMLSSVPDVKRYVSVVTNETRAQLAKDIIDRFETTVMPRYDQLEKGIIHGDFNEQNILVQKDDGNKWNIYGVIDFGDMNYNCLLFEIAITITYIMILGDNIEDSAHFIAGYSKIRKINDLEFDLLQCCIAARMIQSLVLGLHANSQDPSNTYVLTTQARGWNLVEKLWSYPKTDLLTIWKQFLN